MEFNDITKKLIGQFKKKYFYHAEPDWQGFFEEIPNNSIPTVAQDIYKAKDTKKVFDFLQYMNGLPARMFMGCDFIDEVVLPENIDRIGNQLFKNCPNLKKVTIQGNIREIPFECFSGCSSLEEVHLPASVNKIGKGAFAGCPELGFMIYKEKSGKYISVQGSKAEIDFIQSHIEGTNQ